MPAPTYSDRGRMSSALTAGGTVSYLYNALEQRASKTGPTTLVPTGAAYFAYDQGGQLLGEYDASGAPIYETVYLGNIPVGVIKQSGTAAANTITISLYNVYADQIGAPRVITRQVDEQIVWRWDSAEPFGGTAPNQNPTGLGVFAFNQRLPGQVFDQETGLFQNWNREYNPRIGRYMQSDPIGLQGGVNTYAYVEGSPLSRFDSRGLWASKDGFPVHQQVGLYIFGKELSFEENLMIGRAHEWIDGDVNQIASRAFMHAMRNGDAGQSVADACTSANQFLQAVVGEALRQRALGNRMQAVFLFGVALHTLQDNTSPAHGGFQPWSNQETTLQIASHASKEMIDPGPYSPLWTVTRNAWDAYKRGDVNAFRIDCKCVNY